MNHYLNISLVIAGLSFLPACTGEPVERDSTPDPVPVVDSSLTLEQAERALETGGNAGAVKDAVSTILSDPSTTPDERDRALLALSLAEERLGNAEAAVVAVERLLSFHGDDHSASAKAAEQRVRLIQTKQLEASFRTEKEEIGPVAPIAGRLADFFTPDAQGKTTIKLLTFGQLPEPSKKLGTLALAGALMEKSYKRCPLCRTLPAVETLSAGFSSWASSARATSKEQDSLTVYWLDGDDPIPARYDAHLPIPSSQLATAFEAGKGVIAVKFRTGAPPVVVLGAPHQAQLSHVEEAFAKLTELPKEPLLIPLEEDDRLPPSAIQSVVRASFPLVSVCYEALLEQTPSATGGITVGFSINESGSVEDAVIKESSIHDSTMQRCLLKVFSGLRFPQPKGGIVTVVYPVQLAPG